MNTAQILLVVTAIASVAVLATFGIMRIAAAQSGHGHAMVRHAHFINKGDWDNEEKLQSIRETCAAKGKHKIEHFIAHMRDELNLSDIQEEKWQQLISAVRAEGETIHFVCDKIFTKENHSNTLARLELMESLLATGQESLLRVSPMLREFYQELDAKQRETFDKLMSHRRHRGFF